MTERYINQKIFGFFNGDYRLCNTFIFGWESDFFMISKSGYTIEIEIKISYSDFKADFKKTHAYSGMLKHQYLLSDNLDKPNKFYYACPAELIKPKDIDSRYGLIWITEHNDPKIIQQAKFLHKKKQLDAHKFVFQLMQKFYHRYINLRLDLNLREYDLKIGQKRIYE